MIGRGPGHKEKDEKASKTVSPPFIPFFRFFDLEVKRHSVLGTVRSVLTMSTCCIFWWSIPVYTYAPYDHDSIKGRTLPVGLYTSGYTYNTKKNFCIRELVFLFRSSRVGWRKIVSGPHSLQHHIRFSGTTMWRHTGKCKTVWRTVDFLNWSRVVRSFEREFPLLYILGYTGTRYAKYAGEKGFLKNIAESIHNVYTLSRPVYW